MVNRIEIRVFPKGSDESVFFGFLDFSNDTDRDALTTIYRIKQDYGVRLKNGDFHYVAVNDKGFVESTFVTKMAHETVMTELGSYLVGKNVPEN